MMAEGTLQDRILRIALLDPIGDALALLRRLQSNEMFQRYLRERMLHALPLVAGVVIAGLALAWGAMSFIGHAGTFLSVLAAMVSALCVLAGSLLVQAYVVLSWLEGRSLAKLQEHRRARDRGPAARWIAQRLGVDLGPPPRVPWVPAAVLVVLPAAMLLSVAPSIAAGIAALLPAAAIIFARRDPVAGARPTAAAPQPAAQASAGADDLDFSSSAERSSGGLTRRVRAIADSATRTIRSAGHSGRRGVRYTIQLCLLNLLPFVEYCALISGLFVAWTGWQSAADRDAALGVGLVGGALLIGGLASIVTRRMSFRFYLDPRVGQAGAWAIIAGAMQLIAAGLAALATHALATHTWQARLDALAMNPWPLLLPVSLLLICAGLLMMRRSSDRVGPLGTLLFVVPKTLLAIAALLTGVAVLGGWGWKIYDPQAFQHFIRLVPNEYVQVLANGQKQ